MADNSIIDLPLNEDGTGYDREAVDAYLAEIDAHVTAKNDEYETKIAQLEAKSDMAQTTTILTNASNTAQVYVEEARAKADNILRETEENSASTMQEAELKAKSMIDEAKREASLLIATAERTGRSRIADADRRAGNAIEEALTKVQALVGSAQTKLREATARADHLTGEAERRYADAVSMAGSLTAEADDYNDRVRAEADEYAENTRREAHESAAATRMTADRILNEAQAESIRLRRDAETEYDEKMASITADLAAGRLALEHFQNYYDDSLARLMAFYGGKMNEVETLAQFRFPDGYDETEREGVVPDEVEEDTSHDFSQFSAVQYDDSEPPAHLTAGPERETISIDDLDDLDDMIAAATTPVSEIELEDDEIELDGK